MNLRASWSAVPGGRKAALYLGALLALQALISLPRLNAHFLEGRAHWHIDSAWYLLRAIHSQDQTLPSRLGVFGLKQYSYDPEGAVSGLRHYHNHPVLPSLLFNAYARVLGFGRWVPRSYALGFALLTTVLIFLLLRQATEDLELTAVLALLYVVLPLNFNYQDAFKHEVVAAFFVWAGFLCLYNMESPRWRMVFLPVFFLLFQAGWAAYPVAAGMYWHLLRRSRALGCPAFAGRALLAAAAGIAANLVVLHALGATAAAMRGQALLRMGAGLAGVSSWAWAAGQLGFADLNFTYLNMAVMLLALGWACLRPGRAAPVPSVFGGVAAASALAWVCVFRNQSHVHHYVQWIFGTAIVLSCAGAYCELRDSGALPPEKLRSWSLAALVLLLAVSLRQSLRLEALTQEDDFATPLDMRAISGQSRRLVASLDGSSGPRDWWISPVISLYTDPFYKAWLRGRPGEPVPGGVVFADRLGRLRSDSDLVVTLNSADAISRMAGLLKERFEVRCLRPDSISPAFAFFVPVTTGDCSRLYRGPAKKSLPMRL